MSEISVTGSTTVMPTATPAIASATTATATTAITAPPPAITLAASMAALFKGGALRAVVIEIAHGLPVVRTAKGTFMVAGSSVDLPPNTHLILRQTGAPAPQTLLTDVAGRALPRNIPVTLQPYPSGAPASGSATASATVPTAAPVNATVLAGAASGLVAGARLILQPVAELSQTTGAGQSISATAAPARPMAVSSTTPPASSPVASPGPTPAPPAAVRPSSVISGMVTGQMADGRTVLRTNAGLLALALPETPAPGTKLSLQILEDRGPDTARPTTTPVSVPGRDWPALRDAVQVLAAAEPAVLQQMVATHLPQPNLRLASTLLLFFSALPSADPATLLGAEATAALERAGRGDLVRQLAEDAATLTRSNNSSAAEGWRTFLVPLFDGEALRLARLAVRGNGQGNGRGTRPDTRFIVDLELRRTGALQIDGLMHERRLDLIVRSHASLPQQWQHDILTVFGESLAITGMTGELLFRSGVELVHPVEPAQPARGLTA